MRAPVLRVDVATGAAALDAVDLRAGGAMPLVAARAYRSRRETEPVSTPFGPGWACGWDAWLEPGEAWTLRGGPFDGAVFAPVPEGREATQAETGLVIQSYSDAVVVYASSRRRYVYGRSGARGGRLPLIAVRDAGGAGLQIHRAGGLANRVEATDGRALELDVGGGRIRSLTLVANGAPETVAAFEYGLGGELTAATNAAGHTTRYGWDGDYLVEVADAEGARQRAQYDAEGRCLAVWHDRAPVAFTLDYDPLRQTTRAVDAAGGQTVYLHMMGREVVERVAPAGHSDTYIYDEAMRLVGFVRDGAAITFQRLDPETRRLAHLHAETRIAFVQYGADGLAAACEDALENIWTMARHEGALVGLTTPLGACWALSRDRLGRVVAVESPAGRKWTLTHGATTTAADAGARRWSETRDARGRPATRTDRLGRTTTWRWRGDHLDGVAVEGPGAPYGLDVVRDGLGRPARLTDAPARQAVRYTYDATGLVAACEVDGRRVQIRYDGLGRAVEATAPGGTSVRVRYGSNGRLVRIDSSKGTARYDDTDGLTVRSDAGDRTYSPLGELLAREADGVAEAFTYGACGELLFWQRHGGATDDHLLLGHDADGRLTTVSGTVGDEPAEAQLTYDADGRVVAVRLGAEPLPEPEPEPEPEPVLTSFGPVLPEDVRAALAMEDPIPEPDADEAPGAPPVRTLTLEYDDAGRPTRLRSVRETTLRFDDGDRLVEAVGPGGRVALDYDVLDRPVGASQRIRLDDDPAIVLVATAGGVLLGVELGGGVLPLWHRGETRSAPVHPSVCAAVALVRGAEATLPAAGRLRLADIAAWEPRTLDTTAVPSGAALGLPPGPLDLFALGAAHDEAVPVLHVGALAAHHPDATRDDHDATTGPHRTGALRPAPWASRAVGPRFGGDDLLFHDGRLDPDALIDLALDL